MTTALLVCALVCQGQFSDLEFQLKKSPTIIAMQNDIADLKARLGVPAAVAAPTAQLAQPFAQAAPVVYYYTQPVQYYGGEGGSCYTDPFTGVTTCGGGSASSGGGVVRGFGRALFGRRR